MAIGFMGAGFVSFSFGGVSGNFASSGMAVSRDTFIMAQQFGSMKVPLTRSVERVLQPSIARNFEVGGRPSWQPLESSTIRDRGSARPILVRTGHLESVATSRRIWQITNLKAEMRMDNYGKFHQAGTRNMPQREFAVMQDEDLDRIEEIFAQWVIEMSLRFGGYGSSVGGIGNII